MISDSHRRDRHRVHRRLWTFCVLLLEFDPGVKTLNCERRRSVALAQSPSPGLGEKYLSNFHATGGLAQLAGDAALFHVGVAPEGVLAAKARRQRPFLEWKVSVLRREEVAHGHEECRDELGEEKRLDPLVQLGSRHEPLQFAAVPH